MVIGHISLIQLWRIIRFQHPIKSFQFWFLLISLIWCVERAVTFIWSPVLPTRAINFLFIIPASFQFASFSLLVLYNAFVLYQQNWQHYRFYYLLAYGITNGSVIIASFTLAYLTATATQNDRDTVRLINRLHTGWFTFMFSILLVVYAYYGYHLYRHYVNGKQHSGSSSGRGSVWTAAGHSNSSTSQLFLTIIAWCVFFTRWLYNLLTCIDPDKFGLVMNSDRRDFILDIPAPIFCILVVWEILPSSLVLYVSRQIPATDRTLWMEIKQHGIFYCCSKKSRNNALLENQSPYLIDENGNIYPNQDIFQSPSLFGGDLQTYPHVGSYQVLNDDATNTPTTMNYPFDEANMGGDQGGNGHADDQIRRFLPESDVFIGSISDHHTQQYHQTTHHNQKIHLDGISEHQNTEKMELRQQKPPQPQPKQQKNKQNNSVHATSQLQIQIQSQLNQHLAQYNYNDDGGDLF